MRKGEIIEAAGGAGYAEYMAQNVFSPLSMDHTAATLAQSKENGLATGYRNYFGFPVAGEPDYPDKRFWSVVPAGYISSSASDMAKYLQMYLNGGMGIVSQDSLNTMLYDNVSVDGGVPSYYGMGWTLTEECKEPVLGHSGLVENYMSNMFLLPESGLGVVFLIHMNDYLVGNQLADSVCKNVLLILLGEEPCDVSGSSYLAGHLLLNVIYSAFATAAIYPIAAIRKWKKKERTAKGVVFDILRHGAMSLLLCAPYLAGVPLWVVWYFVKDMFLVLLISAGLLWAAGLYKIGFRICMRRRNF